MYLIFDSLENQLKVWDLKQSGMEDEEIIEEIVDEENVVV